MLREHSFVPKCTSTLIHLLHREVSVGVLVRVMDYGSRRGT